MARGAARPGPDGPADRDLDTPSAHAPKRRLAPRVGRRLGVRVCELGAGCDRLNHVEKDAVFDFDVQDHST